MNCRTQTIEERFWPKVDRSNPNGCWLWLGPRLKGNYGIFGYNYKSKLAHRTAWSLVNGDPGELHVLHTCDNPPCCNPKHMFLGTPKDNAEDREQKGRGVRSKGVNNGRAKLNERQVIEIRNKDCPAEQLAVEYKVGVTTIKNIRTRKTWKHI